jgi:molybdenum cofactor biosynthesis enzyme MoaA
MERYINIVDYHQRRNNNHIFFNKKVAETFLPCRNPWTKLVVNQFGLTYNCISPAWLPKSIGSLLDYDDFFDLLNSYEARAIRSEIDLKRYSYCNNKICGILSTDFAIKQYDPDTTDTSLITEDRFTETSILRTLPNEICFDFDYTCNFKCPSCRTEMINHNQGPMVEINEKLVDKIKKVILDRYIETKIPLDIRWAGGEPFLSHAYLELFDYIVYNQATNIKNIVQTNGSYLDRRKKLLKDFLPYIKEFRISFDAGTESSYNKIRINGNWDTLIKNSTYTKNLIISQNTNTDLISDFVIQLENFQEIPQYIDLVKSLGFDWINLNRLWSWGTWEDEEFKRLNVCDRDHPSYPKLIEILKSYENDNMIRQHVY